MNKENKKFIDDYNKPFSKEKQIIANNVLNELIKLDARERIAIIRLFCMYCGEYLEGGVCYCMADE